MSAGQPTWRRVFDTTERAVGRPLESLVSSHRYLDVALFGRRVRGVVGGAIGRPTTAVLHLLNIPARGDVRRLGHQIAALSNEVRELAAGVEELREPTPSREPTAPASKTRPAGNGA